MLTREEILQIKAVVDESIETKVQAIVARSIETKVPYIVEAIVDRSIKVKISPLIRDSITEAFADFHKNVFDPAMKTIEQDLAKLEQSSMVKN